MMDKFILKSKYKPCGDQPQAIESLTEGLNDGLRTQVLLGVTGSGKTFTMANVIANVQRHGLDRDTRRRHSKPQTCKGLRWS